VGGGFKIDRSKFTGDCPEDVFKKYPGIETLSGNRTFNCWWKLNDDTVWSIIYNETGILSGRIKQKYQGTMNRILTNLYKSRPR